MHRFKVIFLMNAFTTGGAENIILRLAERLDRQRFDVTVMAFRIVKPYTFEVYRQKGLSAFSLDMTSLPAVPGGLWRFYRRLRQNQPHLIYNFMTYPIVLGTLMGRLVGVPVCLGSERVMDYEALWRLYLKRLVSLLLDEVTVNSRRTRDYAIRAIGYPPEKVSIIYNGLDAAPYLAEIDTTALRHALGLGDSKVIGCVARLSSQKGHPYLLEAFARLQYADLKLLFVGGGEKEAELRALCRQNGVENRVIFAGNQTNVIPYLKLMDIFVLPSLAEGMPNAVIEAMAAGVPVIATNAGGTAELVADQQTGLLVEPANADQLHAAIMRLLDNPTLAQQLATNARQKVIAEFSLEQMVRQTEQLFDFWLKKKEAQTGVGVGSD